MSQFDLMVSKYHSIRDTIRFLGRLSTTCILMSSQHPVSTCRLFSGASVCGEIKTVDTFKTYAYMCSSTYRVWAINDVSSLINRSLSVKIVAWDRIVFLIEDPIIELHIIIYKGMMTIINILTVAQGPWSMGKLMKLPRRLIKTVCLGLFSHRS